MGRRVSNPKLMGGSKMNLVSDLLGLGFQYFWGADVGLIDPQGTPDRTHALLERKLARGTQQFLEALSLLVARPLGVYLKKGHSKQKRTILMQVSSQSFGQRMAEG